MIGFVVFLIYCIPARWHYVCEIRNLCEDKQPKNATTNIVTKAVAEIPNRTKDLFLKADDVIILADYDQFGFLPNSAELQLTDNNKEYLEGVAKYLRENLEAELKITGYYFLDETLDSTSIYDNLGLARAVAIQHYLETKYNIPTKSVQLDYQLVERNDSEFIPQPIQYDIITNKTLTARGGENLDKASYTFTQMTFSDINFKSNSTEFNPSRNFITYADSVKHYLELNPDKSITIIGHTDGDDDEDYNYSLGLRRANNVAAFLRDEMGINIKKINPESKGEQNPIAPNDTDFNKRKNRRVEMIID